MRIVQAWGMTETSPLGDRRAPARGRRGRGALGATAPRTGRLAAAASRCGSSATTARRSPWDGESTGEIEVRGPWIAARLLQRPGRRREVRRRLAAHRRHRARSTRDGFVRITDRAKDVIKSGGEWISSVELENELMAHPDVVEAAVIAKPDERWAERPLACVVLREGAGVDAEELREHLRGARRQVVAAGRVRVHRRGPEDERRQVRQEGRCARRARGGRARGPREGRRGGARDGLSCAAAQRPGRARGVDKRRSGYPPASCKGDGRVLGMLAAAAMLLSVAPAAGERPRCGARATRARCSASTSRWRASRRGACTRCRRRSRRGSSSSSTATRTPRSRGPSTSSAPPRRRA